MNDGRDLKSLLAQRGGWPVKFNHGAFDDTYEVQANKQGFTLGDSAEFAQKVGFGLVTAYIHGCFTDSEYQKVLEKFQKKILLPNLKALKDVESENE